MIGGTYNWIWLAVPGAVAMLGILTLLGGLGHLFGGEPGRGTRRVFIGFVIAALGGIAGLIALNAQTYARLTHEGPVALVTVAVKDAATSTYAVTVKRTDGVTRTDTCTIQGDEWLIAARVQKWKPWANVLGLDTTYDLDQLTNKYSTAERGDGKPITACNLAGTPPQVNAYVPAKFLTWLLGQSYEERRFGSANYMPLVDSAEYKVVMTQAGLNTEPSNDIAKMATTSSAR